MSGRSMVEMHQWCSPARPGHPHPPHLIDQRCHDGGIGNIGDLTLDVIRECVKVARTPIDGNNHRPFSSEGQRGGMTELSPGSDNDCDGGTHFGSHAAYILRI